jgi:glycosyltransferase involved in cell wall biosynthesis
VSALRVAYVLGTTDGGTGRHVAILASGCVGAGLEVRVFGPAQARPLLRAGPGFEVVSISRRPRPAHDAAAVRRLRRLLAAMRPDIVHAHGMRAGALAALALRPYPAARWPGGSPPALVVTVHNAAPGTAGTAMVYAALERLVARRADAVLCVSADLAARMRQLGAADVGRAVVAASQEAPRSPARPARVRGRAPAELSSDGRPVVLAVGRLAAQKGFDTLVAAAARWRDRRPEPILVVAGAGPLAGELASQARDLGVTARFLGVRDDVPELLAVADAFVLPSRWEGQPLILQEALRAAKPIIATDVGGVRELTGDDAALLVRPGDPAALAGAVLRVLDDARLAAGLSAAAAARAAALPAESDATAAACALYARLAARGATA